MLVPLERPDFSVRFADERKQREFDDKYDDLIVEFRTSTDNLDYQIMQIIKKMPVLTQKWEALFREYQRDKSLVSGGSENEISQHFQKHIKQTKEVVKAAEALRKAYL